MNQDQINSLLRVLLAAGGPVAGLLANAGMEAGTINDVLTTALIVLPPLISLVWGLVTHTDHNTIAAAASVPGVDAIAISPNATGGAARAATNSNLPTVQKAS
jgi:hypothetical protein